MKLGKLNKNNKGFTLLETIVAVGLIAVGLVAALALITTSLFYVSNIQDRLAAANLMAEGIETVRNIRDNNWLQNKVWNNGLANGDYQVSYDYNYSALPFPFYNDNNPLLLNSNGFYNYVSGATTPYKRKVSITNLPNGYEMQVISTVTWIRRGIAYSSSAEDHLFNWK
ncbi:MAG: prepilin-type N-terminal cleavage/methylation domain-containing protein [Candidatus Azambacteria bacterium]|nr:prepilin-type N-terminal cleavage/methylation domain-containing protein [Candidatus Azambacteria bacterium]